MTGLDTNVLIRYIVQDDLAQAKLASLIIESTLSEEQPGYINLIVLCEVVWVLSFAYKFSKNDIIKILKQILITNCFEVEASHLVWNALNNFVAFSSDFSDCLIAELNKEHDIKTTLTFDKKAAKHSGFTLIA